MCAFTQRLPKHGKSQRLSKYLKAETCALQLLPPQCQLSLLPWSPRSLQLLQLSQQRWHPARQL